MEHDDGDDGEVLAANLEAEREARAWSYEHLTRQLTAAGLRPPDGVSTETVRQWLTGRGTTKRPAVPRDALPAFASVFGLDLLDLQLAQSDAARWFRDRLTLTEGAIAQLQARIDDLTAALEDLRRQRRR